MAFEYLKYVVEGIDKNAVLHDLMEAYGKDVWNYAFFLTLRSDVADDVMQDVFLKVYERMYSFRGESSVKTWLRRVTLTNRFFGMPASESAENEVLDTLTQQQVWQQVLGLPNRLREVLLLTVHHGLSMKEISQLLDVSEGTVKSRLFRARAKINRKLKEGDTE